jgi:hypothetical protein
LSERLVVLGEPAEAARHLQRVVEAPVVDIDDWLYRSLALARLGRRAESEASAHHYVTLRPGHAHGTFHLVSLLLDAGGFDESATLLGESIELSGGEAAVLATLVLRLRLARPAAGDALMTRLVALCDGDAQAMLRDVSRRRRRGGASS